MSFSPLRQLGYSHLHHHLNPTGPSFTYIAAFETKGYILICTVIWNSMDFTMSESPNSPDEDESLVQLSESCQLLEQSAGCLPRNHCLKPKFEELMGDLEAEILRMKKGSEGFRQTPIGSASIDTPPAGPKNSSSPSPNIARPKPERRPTPDFFRRVVKRPPLTEFTPQQDYEMQNPGGRKPSHPHSLHSRPSRVEKTRKLELTPGQKVLRNIRKERRERAKMFF
ncbi:uncharacterized protein B0J16DRAFT_333750 [Fusarium flagelliforme]|uniref:uncharacterized protein n=1 Tax=Fusarium flagelliforme TaxID=2675880 RepID=UPI001E8D1118|nr:uncharacterized protein B0J16DRAFT_333750 [Fusarium flagelliforme]KAH7192794.1 hypothetical protein B0J16DRAFT_333750 [Fusarium flagelliforme]